MDGIRGLVGWRQSSIQAFRPFGLTMFVVLHSRPVGVRPTVRELNGRGRPGEARVRAGAGGAENVGHDLGCNQFRGCSNLTSHNVVGPENER